MHAKDRLVQMELQRLAGQGRLSEALKSSNETLAIDTYFRFLKYSTLLFGVETHRVSVSARRGDLLLRC